MLHQKNCSKTFAEFPFGEVDSVIFSILSYFDWSVFGLPVAKDAVPLPLKATVSEEGLEKLFSIRPFGKLNRKFWIRFVSSKRYQDLSVAYFSSFFSAKDTLQFAAVTFFLGDGRGVISYRGTDGTTVGWREDFNMALFDTVPSQHKAIEYLDTVTSFFSAPFFITGHSKGGNLSLYSATHTSLQNKQRLIMARSHDGPGFWDVDSHIDALIPILKKVSSTVPQDSIIGALLGFKRNSKIVLSKAFLLNQHNPFSWRIDPKTGDFVYLKYRKNSSMRREVALNHWLVTLKEEEKQHILDLCFMLLDPDGNGKVDFGHHRLRQTITIIKRYRALNQEDKAFIRRVFKRLFASYKGLRMDNLIYKKITIFD